MPYELTPPREQVRLAAELDQYPVAGTPNTWDEPFAGDSGATEMLITPGSPLADFAERAAHQGSFAIADESISGVAGMRDHDTMPPTDDARSQARDVRTTVNDLRRALRKATQSTERPKSAPAPIHVSAAVTRAIIKGLTRMARAGQTEGSSSLDAADAAKAQYLLDRLPPDTTQG